MYNVSCFIHYSCQNHRGAAATMVTFAFAEADRAVADKASVLAVLFTARYWQPHAALMPSQRRLLCSPRGLLCDHVEPCWRAVKIYDGQ
jgi:hypothetical protein